jgi:uncharacterized repeat protein (TIGR01451 family)
MTKQTANTKTGKPIAFGQVQTGDRSIPALQGGTFVLVEDFSRTIRSFCSRVVSPPIDFADEARRSRWKAKSIQAGNKNFIGSKGNREMNIENNTTSKTNEIKPRGGKTMDYSTSTIFKSLARNRLTASFMAMAIALGSVTPAFATIDNTVTVTGSSPSGTDDVTNTATENVDVVDAIDTIAITKFADDDTDVAVGQTVTYTYTATNTGNRTLTNVSMADTSHEGSGSVSALVYADVGGGSPLTDNGTTGDSTDTITGDTVWDVLAPGDTITWEATYVVTQADLNSNGGDGDGELTNTAVTVATAPGGVADAVTNMVDESIDLEDVNPSLLVTKFADDDTDVVVGQTITYTYTVTNNGNVPITNISLSDNVTAGSGTAPTPGNETFLTDLGAPSDSSDAAVNGTWDTLGPLDSVTFTGTYVVTQSDVDNLQ